MLLQEILDVEYLPVKWITNSTGTFSFMDKQFGIIIESIEIDIQTRYITVCNISFGVVIDITKPITHNNINRELTNFGKPRTVMATVGRACVSNPHIQDFDIILVAAADQVKQKRIGIYTLAISELATQLPGYKHSYRAITQNGSILVVRSRIELSQTEVDYISKEVLQKSN